MGLELTGGFAGIDRTSDILPFNADYTWCMWIRLDGAAGGDHEYINISDGTDGDDGYDRVVFNSSGQVYTNTKDEASSSGDSEKMTISASVWHHVVMVRADTSNLWLYLDGVKSSSSANVDISGRATADRMFIREIFGNGFMVHGAKAWTRELTIQEIRSEMNSTVPVVTDGVYGFWPLLGPDIDLNDYSGQGRDMAQVGGDELFSFPGPPIPWGSDGDAAVFLPAAAVAASASPALVGTNS